MSLILLVVLHFSCKHDSFVLDDTTKKPIVLDSCEASDLLYTPAVKKIPSGLIIPGLACSPNDPNIFIYRRRTNNKCNYLLYNIITKENVKILEGPDECKEIYWTKNNKIIFNYTLYDYWCMNPDGTGLKQITHGGINFGLAPSLTGDSILFLQAAENPPFLLIQSDLNGNYIDTINRLVHIDSSNTAPQTVWLGKYIITDVSTELIFRLIITNTDKKETKSVVFPNLNYSSMLYKGLLIPNKSNEVLLYGAVSYLFKFNYINYGLEIIRNRCPNNQIVDMSVNADGSKIICSKIFNQQTGVDTITRFWYLSIMNIDGTGEYKLELPE
jgi:hypothetical protein